MTTPKMPPLVQTEAQKAYCTAALEKAESEKAARIKLVERMLGQSLGGVMESRIQLNANMQDSRIVKAAEFARQHNIKVCVGSWTGVIRPTRLDADDQLAQIVLGFDYGVYITPEQIADFAKADKA